jgi:Cdc6-like AAA superfamily ATPase
MAKEVALKGLSQLEFAIPRLEIGDLDTVDRREIEALRSIQGLIGDYARNRSESTPLNLVVFGPPGSGKSFFVEQVAKSVSRTPRKTGSADG